MGERLIPILPCRSLDDVAGFYAALGFAVTYRQERPNPYLCLTRGTLDLHFFALDTFDPAQSMGSAILLTADPGALFDEFAAGLRAAYGRLPLTGLPRITRPRRKQGTASGFSVVDPGGNWLRVAAEREEPASTDTPAAGRLERVLRSAARQGDARGDVAAAIGVLEAGLVRYADAPPAERVGALAYLAELQSRLPDVAAARATLDRLAALPLTAAEREQFSGEQDAAAEVRASLPGERPGL